MRSKFQTTNPSSKIVSEWYQNIDFVLFLLPDLNFFFQGGFQVRVQLFCFVLELSLVGMFAVEFHAVEISVEVSVR